MRAILLLLAASFISAGALIVSAQSIQSLYSDLESSKCKTLESQEEGSYALQQCPGIAGFKLLVEDFDLRQTVTVVKRTAKASAHFGGVTIPACESRPKVNGAQKEKAESARRLIVRFMQSEPEVQQDHLSGRPRSAGENLRDRPSDRRALQEEARSAADRAATNPPRRALNGHGSAHELKMK